MNDAKQMQSVNMLCNDTSPKLCRHNGEKFNGESATDTNADKRSANKFTIWTQVLAAFAGAFCQAAVGGMYGFPGVVLPQLMNPESDDLILNKSQASLFNSVLNLGNLVGCLLAGVLMTWVGQRKCLLLILPLGVIGWITLGLAPSFGVLLLSRLILGTSTGLFTANSYNYLVELTHTSLRGRLMAISDLFRQISYTMVIVIGSFNLTWRQQAFIQILYLLIPFMMLLFLPDSPRWLVMKGRKSEAYDSLLFFRGNQYDVNEELQAIKDQVERNTKHLSVTSQLKLLKSKSIFLIFLKTSLMMFFLYFGGNLVVASYSVVIFTDANISVNPYLSSIIAVGMRIFGAISYLVISGYVKRKTIFCIPLLFGGLSLFLVGLFFYLQLDHNVSSVDWIPVVLFSIFNFCTSLYFPVFMLVRAELLPNDIRSLGSGIQFGLLAISAFITTLTYPYMVEYFGIHVTFWIYGSCNLLMCAYVTIFIPETKGKTLEEIGDMFLQKSEKVSKTSEQSRL